MRGLKQNCNRRYHRNLVARGHERWDIRLQKKEQEENSQEENIFLCILEATGVGGGPAQSRYRAQQGTRG